MKPSWITVLRDCLAEAKPLPFERVPRHLAQGRILAEEIWADRDYPAADLSMMDGYAVGAANLESYCIEGENRPGTGAGAPLPKDQARRIFTGAELPSGATRIVPQERVRREGDQLFVQEWPDSPFVRPRGREARREQDVLQKGAVLGAVELAILATVGCTEVDVVTLPRVGHLITGDEIVSPDAPLEEGKLRDSNSDLVAAILGGSGFRVALHDRVSDDRDVLFKKVHDMSGDCDFLLISGGASVGDHDHARPALEAAGYRFLAHGLNVRPGRPVGVARRGSQWAMALPGNPLSHLAVLHLLVLPLLRACAGWGDCEPKLIRGILDGPLPAEVPSRDTFWPAVVTLHEGDFHLRPGRFLSSGDLIGVAGVNALISLPSGKATPQVREPVHFLTLSPFLA
jgi:molybdopterin molybdotransferase